MQIQKCTEKLHSNLVSTSHKCVLAIRSPAAAGDLPWGNWAIHICLSNNYKCIDG